MFDVNQTSIDNAIHIDMIMSSFARYFLVILNIVILFVSIGGNTIVLYGSLVHNALRMDKITLLLVKNVAVSDMLIALLFYLPALTNLLHGSWVLGYGMCFINGWMSLVPNVVEIITLVVLSCYRLSLIVGAVSRSFRHNLKPWYVGLAVLWFSITILPFFFSALDFLPWYDPYTQSCNSANMANAQPPIYKIALIALLNVCLNIFPMFVITTTNIFILISIYKTSARIDNKISYRGSIKVPEANKKKHLPTRTIKAIPMICLTFIFSYFPYLIACLSNFGIFLPAWWRTLSFYFAAINIVSNPLIYAAVNLEFRKYCFSLVGLAELSSGDTTNTFYKPDGSSSIKSVPEPTPPDMKSYITSDDYETTADES
ncbi:green-sensitive opsin-1-like [Bolinopsis microptera]|uniref:green-sensitive opsin-1-like n=1 Tax=Bolinopsis microptera TaxID=2820187 RepID=UPI00307AD4B4